MSGRGSPARARPALSARLAGSAPLSAAWSGFGAAAAGCFVAVVAALVLWIPDSSATGSSGSTVRAGVMTFLAAQRGGLTLNGVRVGFVPLGLTLLAGWICWRAGRALLASPAIGPQAPAPVVVRLVAIQVAVYAGTCAGLTRFAVVGTSSAPTIATAVGAVVVGGLGFLGAAAQFSDAGAQVWDSWGTTLRASLRGAAAATLVVLTGGAVLALVATVRQAGRFVDLSRGFGGGVSGLPVGLLDALAAPNAVVAASAYLTGPGFSVGAGSSYAPFGGRGGPVPAFPVLAGLPAGGTASIPVLLLMVATLVSAAVAAGRLIRRDDPRSSWPGMLRACVGAAGFSGVALGGLAAAAGGPLGAHRLHIAGASPWWVGLAAAVEVGLLTTAAATLDRLWRRAGRPASVAERRLAAVLSGPADANQLGEGAGETTARALISPSAVSPSAVSPSALSPGAASPSVAAGGTAVVEQADDDERRAAAS